VFTIKFYAINGQVLPYGLPEVSDECIQEMVRRAEDDSMLTLHRDLRTSFPAFVIFDEDGVEIGGN
jgi:hypothetical protein